jgi:hypothetical protein
MRSASRTGRCHISNVTAENTKKESPSGSQTSLGTCSGFVVIWSETELKWFCHELEFQGAAYLIGFCRYLSGVSRSKYSAIGDQIISLIDHYSSIKSEQTGLHRNSLVPRSSTCSWCERGLVEPMHRKTK